MARHKSEVTKPDAQIPVSKVAAGNDRADKILQAQKMAESSTVVNSNPLPDLPEQGPSAATIAATPKAPVDKGAAQGAAASLVKAARTVSEDAGEAVESEAPVLQWYRVMATKRITGFSGQRSTIPEGAEFHQYQRNPKRLLAQGVKLQKITEEERYS